MEYHFIEFDKYKAYQYNAQILLDEVSRYFNISQIEIKSEHVISYCEQKYDINFIFVDVDPYEEYFRNLGGRQATWEDIRYRGLVSKAFIQFVPKEVCKSLSGMTTTCEDSKRYVIYISQYAPIGRVIFSILHELSHIFAHFEKDCSPQMYASMKSNVMSISSGNYPKELQDSEDEANVMASLFLINDYRLRHSILLGKSFNTLIAENRITGTAIFNRLRNFLTYNYNVPSSQVFQIILDYRNGNNRSLLSVVSN